MSIFGLSFLRNKTAAIALAAIALALVSPVQATEETRRLEDDSFLERYTNKAQDLILKGLEMVGVNYRRGGTDPDSWT
jgi:hypothetical protein